MCWATSRAVTHSTKWQDVSTESRSLEEAFKTNIFLDSFATL